MTTRQVYAFWYSGEIVAQVIATSLQQAFEKALDHAYKLGTYLNDSARIRAAEVAVYPVVAEPR